MFIDLEKAKEEFIKYTDEFDTSLFMIDLKKWHSLRVMDLSIKIATNLGLTNEDIEIAGAIRTFT